MTISHGKTQSLISDIYNTNISLQLYLTLKSADGGDTSTYVENGEWALLGTIDVNYQF